MRKYVEIKEKSYPNPYGLYDLEITRGDYVREYQVNEDRGKKILGIIGRGRLSVELVGGTLSVYGFYPWP